MKKTIALALAALMLLALLTACAAKPAETEPCRAGTDRADRTARRTRNRRDCGGCGCVRRRRDARRTGPARRSVYTADFNTDSSMFHVNARPATARARSPSKTAR
ncbi:MAG: hypothetical protein ACLU3I_12060 [Acutalibacteraceae bacterium]